MGRRFLPPWSIEESAACFIVRDISGHAVACVYFEDEAGRQSAAKLLSHDEARWIAANIAKLPDLLRQPLERRASMITVVKAIRDAQRALVDHLAAKHPDDRATFNALLGILDDRELIAALDAVASDGPRLFPGEPESDEGQ